MKAAILREYGDLDSIQISNVPIPELRPGQVLVQMKCAAMNVSDLMYALGLYLYRKPLPTPLGFEGSGLVVQGPPQLLGKKVAVALSAGIYSEYIAVSAASVFVLNDDVSFEQGASLIVNPMTVACMIDHIEKERHQGVVINAAASALGKMLIRWCMLNNLPVVCLVRRQEQADIVRSLGAQHVFNTSQKGWFREARKACQTMKVSVGFDAVAGKEAGDMMSLLIKGGVVYNYGGLSGEVCQIKPYDLMADNKRIEGLYLFTWITSQSRENLQNAAKKVQSFLGKVFKTEYAKEIALDDLPSAYKTYAEKKTDGKILVRISH